MLNKLFLKTFNILGFAIPLLSDIFIFLDGIIYAIADFALRGFFEIARISGQTSLYASQIKAITSRVMVLAGIYALFRLAFMLINYIMNPDKTGDITKNGSSFVKNIIIAVVLLVSAPFIFDQMGNLQNLILDNHVIENIIYGANQYDESQSLSNETNSKKFVNNVFLLFFQDSKGTCSSVNNSGAFCTTYRAVADGTAGVSSLTFGEQFQFTYYPVISGIAGILLIYYFVVYSIGLATRMLKLVTLQIISPIPIITSIDPSQKGKLGKFARTYFDVWLQVFIRILTVYLAYVVCGLIADNSNIINNSASSAMLLEINFLIRAILYFGIFQGAKELPKLLDNALGMKIAPDTHAKGFGQVLATVVGGGLGIAGGAVAGGIAGGAGGALSGALSGGLTGAAGMASAKNVGAGVAAAVNAVKKGYGTGLTTAAVGGIGGLVGAKLDNFTGTNARIDREVASAKKLSDSYANFENAVKSDYAKSKINGVTVGEMNYQNDPTWMSASHDLDDYFRTHTHSIDQSEMDRLNNNIDNARAVFDNSERGAALKANMEKAEQDLLAATPTYDNIEGLDMNSSDYAKLQADYENSKLAYDSALSNDSFYKKAINDRDNYVNSGRDNNEINRLKNIMKTAEQEYNAKYMNDAFAAFEEKHTKVNTDGTRVFDVSDLERRYNNPSERVELSEAEKRYYELSRETKDFVPNNNKNLEQVFKEQKAAANKTLEIAQNKQQTDQYRRADTAKNHKFGGK